MQNVRSGVNRKPHCEKRQNNKEEVMKKTKRKIGIVYKLIGMSVLPVMVLGIILTAYGEQALKKSMKSEINNGLKSAAVAIEGAYDAAGTGDFTLLESGNVIKGTFLVNNNYNLVDNLRDNSEMEAGVFYGDTQIVTSLTDDKGERLADVTVSDEVRTKVLSEGTEYFSENVQLGNNTYFGYYMPIRNEDGTVAGMIFTGKESTSVKKVLEQETTKMILISVLLIAVAAVFTGIMAISIVKVLKLTMKSLGKVAEGNLAEQDVKPVKRRDEIGDMLTGINHLRTSLRDVIGSIRQSSDILNHSADGLEDTAFSTSETSRDVGIAVGELSKGAMSQAEETEAAMNHIDQMGSRIEEMVADIQLLTKEAEDMERTSSQVQTIVTELSAFTQKTTQAVEMIAAQTQTTNLSAQEIQKAVEIIQSIAEETNLLSLNASIEAARAGEQGKGFAVVAGQIQKLADQSNNSAKQIESVIAVLLEDSQKTVNTMDEMVEIVNGQQEKLQETEKGFIKVNEGIQESLDKIEGIRSKSEVIDVSRKQIMEVISNLSAISEENASVAAETAQAANNLNKVVQDTSDEAVALKKLVKDLEEQIGSFEM